MGKSTISMVMFNSYFDITRGYPKGAPSRITSESLSQLAKDLSFSFGQQSWDRWTQTDRVKQQFQGQGLWKSRTGQQFYGPKKWQRSSQQWQDSWAWDGWVDWKWLVAASAKLHGEYKNRAHSNAYPTRLPVLVAWVVLSSHWLARSLTLWCPAIRRPFLESWQPKALSSSHNKKHQVRIAADTSWYQLLVGIL